MKRRKRARGHGDEAMTAPKVPRGRYIGKLDSPEPADEHEHFMRCPICGARRPTPRPSSRMFRGGHDPILRRIHAHHQDGR
jgi:hypothetical protein